MVINKKEVKYPYWCSAKLFHRGRQTKIKLEVIKLNYSLVRPVLIE
jgi:hypothetical protein